MDMFNPSPSTWKWRLWYWFQMTCKLKQLHEDNLDTINCHSSPFCIKSRTRKLGWLMLRCYLKWMTDECWIQQNVSHDLAVWTWKHKAQTTSAQTSQQFRPLNRQSAVDNTAFFFKKIVIVRRQDVHAICRQPPQSMQSLLGWGLLGWECLDSVHQSEQQRGKIVRKTEWGS